MHSPSSSRWRRFWTRFARPHGLGRLAAHLAAWNTPPFHGRAFLSYLHPRGFVAPSASITHPRVVFGKRVYLGDRVVLSADRDPGPIELADGVHVYGDAAISTGSGARIAIGAGTHVQPGAHIHARLSSITIGRNVDIAPRCAFYSYNHRSAPGELIMFQPLESKGEIVVGDGCWLAHGVIVLAGVRIGDGAVIGAGSIVTHDIPPNAIAAGQPAKVLRYRTEAAAVPLPSVFPPTIQPTFEGIPHP